MLRLPVLFTLGVVIMFTNPVAAQQRTQARSMVISRQGIVASSQTLASQAGAQVLARGGTAMDAAIAANLVLTVVEPMSCGIGGDLFALYYEAKSGKLTGINASGWSPRRWTRPFFLDKGYTSGMPQEGIHSATVPGCVDGWRKLHRQFGKRPWAELFAPAIYYAREGFPVTEIIQDHWRGSYLKLSRDDYARKVFLPDGEAPRVGGIFRNRDLAHTYEILAREGADAFYRGAVAKALLAVSSRLGGVMEAADLADFSAEWVEPVRTTYRGWTVYELPPNSQGVAALEMLNILEQFPLGSYAQDSVEAFHLKIEAQKLAYQDLRRHLADPLFAKIPLDGLLDKEYAKERARLIDPARARCEVAPGEPPLPPAGDTVYLAAIDQEGNIASLIQSIYLSFGSGVAVEGHGFHLHNRGGLFDLEEGRPNVVAPRKRPFHTIIPALMEKDNLRTGFGIMGGLNQAQAHAQYVSNIADHGMNIQLAFEAPRFTKLDFGGCGVMIENRVPPHVREALTARGHQLEVQGDFSGWMGGGQAVMRDSKAGVNYGASSPRKDGAAIPEPAPYFPAARPGKKR